MTQLTDKATVEGLLGRALSSDEEQRIDAIINKISALFCFASGRKFEAGTITNLLKVNGFKVFLPEQVATEIVSIIDEYGEPVPTFQLVGQWLYLSNKDRKTPVPQFVSVSYVSSGVIPDVVRYAIADDVRQALEIDAAARGGQVSNNRTVGEVSSQITFAPWAQGGSARLTPDTQALADRLAISVPTTWVQEY